jgi:predicted HTH transcriptional regulator
MVDRRERDEQLLGALRREPRETPWLEFKVNNGDPQEIGEYISALANGAALQERPTAYLVWGVHDADHAVVGTNFDPTAAKVGNEDLLPWLLRLTSPHVSLDAVSVDAGARVWILKIGAARSVPVAFKKTRFVRVGSYKKLLADHPEMERRLWLLLNREPFESGVAVERLGQHEVLSLLDYDAYFELLKVPHPGDPARVLEHLDADGIVVRSEADWSITNLGAVLFARRMRDFGFEFKQVRAIHYNGSGRTDALHERESEKGYAAGFEGLIEYITGRLPHNEEIVRAFRVERSLYPEIAIRELMANMMIHQDFTLSGTHPMVEIFDGRIEFTNLGRPLLDPRRFVDLAPKSRNERLASMMRRANLTEHRGSGWDKIAREVELYQLPAPRVDVLPEHTRAHLLGPQPLTRMDRSDRVRAVYLHACLRQITGRLTTNASVRERFGIAETNAPLASRILREAVGEGVIMVANPDDGVKARHYLPFWAVRRASEAD